MYYICITYVLHSITYVLNMYYICITYVFYMYYICITYVLHSIVCEGVISKPV